MITQPIRFHVIAKRPWKAYKRKSLPHARRFHGTPTPWFFLRAGVPVEQ